MKALNDREFNKFTEDDLVRVALSDDPNSPTTKYTLADADDTDENNVYLGYLAKDSTWYIKNIANNQFRWIKGDSDYPTNWTNRASLTYGYFDAVFG